MPWNKQSQRLYKASTNNTVNLGKGKRATMGWRRDESVEWLKKGFSIGDIAIEMKVSSDTVFHYLCDQVGAGKIRRSDILYSIPRDLRELTEGAIVEHKSSNFNQLWKKLCPILEKRYQGKERWVLNGDAMAYFELRAVRIVLGDLYEYIYMIEVELHDLIEESLRAEHGVDNWWRNGIPQEIRAECAKRKELDSKPVSDIYRYTDLIDLKKIIDSQWNLLVKKFPAVISKDKKIFLSRLTTLNGIRNAVMHPVRGEVITEDDFLFVKNLFKELEFKDVLNV